MACRVYGTLSDIQGNAISGAGVSVSLTIRNQYYDSGDDVTKILFPSSVSITTDSNGYWEVNLLDNENMVNPSYYKFEFTYDGETYVWEKYIPDQTEAEFTTLSDMG